jgi:hypothetical protein
MRFKALCSLVAPLLLLCFAPLSSIHAEQNWDVIATDKMVQGKVLRLDIPADLDGLKFTIAWGSEDGGFSARSHVTRAGSHAYEMRDLPDWGGWAGVIATNLSGVRGEVVTPSFADEVDMFLAPERCFKNTIHAVYGHTLFGIGWNIILLGCSGLATVVIRLSTKRTMLQAMVLGFMIAWALQDVRTAYDHLVIARKYNEGPLTLEQRFKTATGEMIKLEKEMVEGSSWVSDGVRWPFEMLVSYLLAEHRHADEPSQADFIIRQGPDEKLFFQRKGS